MIQKLEILKNQPYQTVLQATQQPQSYHPPVQRLCISKLVQIFTVMKKCLLVLNGLILFKLVIIFSTIIEFQF